MNVKRFIAILLVLILFLSLLAGIIPAVSAAGAYTVGLQTADGKSKITLEPGDSIQVQLVLSNNPGILSVGAQIAYPAEIRLTNAVSKISGGNFNPRFMNSATTSANPYLVWMSAATGTKDKKLVSYNGAIQELTFQVLEDTKPGDYAFTLKAPSDKNLTADTNASGVIQANTNKAITGIALDGFTITVKAAACDHKWGAWQEISPATCTKDGKQSRQCSLCQKMQEQIIDATGHNVGAFTTQKKPTCTEVGIEKGACQNSGCSYTQTKEIPALGHSFSKPEITKAPTCTAEGIQSGKCSRCNQKTTQPVPATGHSYGQWQVTKAATCIAEGVQTKTCTKCKDQQTEKIPKSGHQFSQPEITKDPTCTQSGEQTGKCIYCNQNAKEEIPAVGHSYNEGIVTAEATCDTPGSKTQTCQTCQDTVTQEIPALGHSFAESVVIREATATVPGVLQSKCTRCGETQDTEIPCVDQETDDKEIYILVIAVAGIMLLCVVVIAIVAIVSPSKKEKIQP